MKGVQVMQSLFKKVLLLTAVFAVIFICILNSDSASAAFEPSKKVKVKKVRTSVTIERDQVSSRGNTTRTSGTSSTLTKVDIEDSNVVIAYAMSFQGVKYQYGAVGPNSYDCSGFTMTVMKKFGIKLPRTSIAQSSYGTPVPRGSLQPGDLVFFATSGGTKVSHVGIYAGNNNFIHISVNRGHTVSSLNETYYRTRYVKATRVIR